jgi:ATP-dependent Clp protease ATP-binding subunit ClpA
MFERFTKPARTVVESATTYAQRATAAETRPEHLLQALLADESCLATRVLADAGAPAGAVREELTRHRAQYVDGLDADDAEALKVFGIDLDEVVRRIDRHIAPWASRASTARRPRFSRSSKKVMELALREALALRHNYIGTEHLLLGLVRVDDRVVADTLRTFGLERAALRTAVAEAVRKAG